MLLVQPPLNFFISILVSKQHPQQNNLPLKIKIDKILDRLQKQEQEGVF